MIFKNIFAKKYGKKLAFFTRNNANFCKKLIMTLVFEKKANFFAENCRNSQKIMIITLSPGWGQCYARRLTGDFELFGARMWHFSRYEGFFCKLMLHFYQSLPFFWKNILKFDTFTHAQTLFVISA
jgi:hypothetical protein